MRGTSPVEFLPPSYGFVDGHPWSAQVRWVVLGDVCRLVGLDLRFYVRLGQSWCGVGLGMRRWCTRQGRSCGEWRWHADTKLSYTRTAVRFGVVAYLVPSLTVGVERGMTCLEWWKDRFVQLLTEIRWLRISGMNWWGYDAGWCIFILFFRFIVLVFFDCPIFFGVLIRFIGEEHARARKGSRLRWLWKVTIRRRLKVYRLFGPAGELGEI